MDNKRGFTLLEILVALFIFTILSMILASSLHHLINLQSGAEANAERLRKLQTALLIMSRDIEQAVNRSVLNSSGKLEAAFIGSANGFTFTHAGFANSTAMLAQSSLQRTRYVFDHALLWRMTWDELDQAAGSRAHSRELLADIADAHFQYLDEEGRFHHVWPLEGKEGQPLPRAVRVFLTISKWGTMSQLYVISAQNNKTKTASKSQ